MIVLSVAFTILRVISASYAREYLMFLRNFSPGVFWRRKIKMTVLKAKKEI